MVKFNLIVVNEKAPFDTKDYMESINSQYVMTDSIKTDDLTLFTFSRE
ncbi:hypothetical protein V8V91_05220 [Algoriphagus halophilus]